MADNKKYYYMRLNENYFDSETQVLLESMPDGYLYSNILLKLYLKSLKNDGRLMFNDKIPYSPQMIATITRHQVGTVEKALEIFKELNIIDLIDTGAIYMLDIQNFIGKSNTEADRKRAYRKRIETEKGQMSLNCPLEIEKELEIELEKDIELDNKPKTNVSKSKFKKPTLEEVQQYCDERNNNINPEQFIDYYEANGWKVGKNSMKDWKAAIRTWEKRDNKQPTRKELVPDWLNKDIKEEKINESDQKKLEERIKNR